MWLLLTGLGVLFLLYLLLIFGPIISALIDFEHKNEDINR
jgi:hypothetical protein